MGLTFLLTCALTGSEMWLAPTSAFAASPFRWLNWLSESRATLTAAPNFAYSVIGKYARRVPDVDLGRLRLRHQRRRADRLRGLRAIPVRARPVRTGPATAPHRPTDWPRRPAQSLAPVRARALRYDEVHAVDGAMLSRRHAVLGQSNPRDGVADRPNGEAVRRSVAARSARSRSAGTSMMSGYLGADPLAPDDWFTDRRSRLPGPMAAWWSAAGRRSSSPSRAATCSRPR